MIITASKNKLKPDIVLKNFWRNNARFADLFNGSLFGGEKNRKISTELGLAIGAAAESRKLMNKALKKTRG